MQRRAEAFGSVGVVNPNVRLVCLSILYIKESIQCGLDSLSGRNSEKRLCCAGHHAGQNTSTGR